METTQHVLNRILCKASRSKLTTCLRKERLLKFKLNSTATSDGSAQKLGNDVWHDPESIETKVYSQSGCKRNAMFESYVLTCIDRISIIFWFEDFFFAICN